MDYINYKKMQCLTRVKWIGHKPLDVEAVLTAARETGIIVTIEEHSVIGGLGSAVAEALAEADARNIPMKRLGIPDVFCLQVGSQEYLRRAYSLSIDGIVKSVFTLLSRKC